jgi:3-phenylpropionate/trans-cinnamate dioxygenase ferredoxin reductase subunit
VSVVVSATRELVDTVLVTGTLVPREEILVLAENDGVRIVDDYGHHPVEIAAVLRAAREVTDGRVIAADFVIVGVGVVPVTALAEAAGVALDNGIATDAMGRTNVAHIWAAGDCASFPWGAGRLRLESVGNAIEQAEAVADNILGANTPYLAHPWFWSDQYDTKLQIAGLNTGYDRVVTRGPEGHSVSFWYYRADTLLAVDAMNDSRAYMVGKRLIEMGKSPDPAAVADLAVQLKALLK